MTTPPLFEVLQQKVTDWRSAAYASDDYPAIAEILHYAQLPEVRALRFLRPPQLGALETYWYLRVVDGTPHIRDLYVASYPKTSDLLTALGLGADQIKQLVIDQGLDPLWHRIRTDQDFVKQHKLESVHETWTLDYPSYILALAMGAGKTFLIGAIIASEFAMALEYPDGPFVKNALVFAPGLTILESLRQLAAMPFDKVLPPRFHKAFEASYKLTFTRDGEQDLPIVKGSSFNLIVTNTEKIRIQKRRYRHPAWSDLYYEHMLHEYEATANRRLQTIASLPSLGVFSDEAHHTYGKDMEAGLKRVRQTVDYLHDKTQLLCVINTTGTPYYKRQPLRDVVIWYGLSQGIRDGILKPVADNIYAYDFDQSHADRFVAEVVRDFFQTYGEVALPDGAPARLAMYFPQTKDLRELRPVIERTLTELSYPADIVLRNTSRSTQAEIDDFNRLNNPNSRHRVILLVNKGTEGWDCPSLFACALARKLRTSRNFVLQASTRCLRQVADNDHHARIYLSMDNRSILDRQLQQTFGETITELNAASQDLRTKTLKLRKLPIPRVALKQTIKRVVSAPTDAKAPLQLTKPQVDEPVTILKHIYTPVEQAGKTSVLEQVDQQAIPSQPPGRDLYSSAVHLAAVYRVDPWTTYLQLKQLYGPAGYVPEHHIPHLVQQIEQQARHYEVKEEEVDVALALVKPEGFERTEENGNVVYTAEITYHKDREHLLLSWEDLKNRNPGDFGFHYTPYDFDSNPEKSFFLSILNAINSSPDDVEDIYFTGGLTDPNKTDFFVEYKGTDDRWHRYTPDFLIRRKDGRCYIVEIKMEKLRNDDVDGDKGRKAMALRRWEDLNPETLKYEIVFTSSDTVAFNQLQPAKDFIQEK